MKKRVIVIGLLLISFSSIGLFAAGPGGLTGIGVFASFAGLSTGDTGTNFGLTMKFGNFPVLGIAYNFGEDNGNLGISCDYWVWNQKLSGTAMYYFVGIGAYGGMASNGDNSEFDFGLRAPIGLQFWPIRKFELFVDFVPMVGLLPSVVLDFAVEVGGRVHF